MVAARLCRQGRRRGGVAKGDEEAGSPRLTSRRSPGATTRRSPGATIQRGVASVRCAPVTTTGERPEDGLNVEPTSGRIAHHSGQLTGSNGDPVDASGGRVNDRRASTTYSPTSDRAE